MGTFLGRLSVAGGLGLLMAGIAQVAHAGAAAVPQCGETITRTTTLAADVGPCSGDGIVAGADNINLNLAGHTVFGNADPLTDTVGIRLTGRAGVTVEGGTVTGFATGVSIQRGSHDNTVSGMDLHDNIGLKDGSGNYGDGVGIFGSSHNLVINNKVAHNGPFDGIGVFGNNASGSANPSFGNRLENNVVENNTILRTLPGIPDLILTLDDGINLGQGLGGSSTTTIVNNVVKGNGLNGIDACSIRGNPCFSDYNVIDNNVVRGNGFTNLSTDDVTELGRGISISDIIAHKGFSGNFFPQTHDVISNNRVTGNASTGLAVYTAKNRILNNYIVGNGDNGKTYFDSVDFYLLNGNVGIDCSFTPAHLAGNVIKGNTFGTVIINSLVPNDPRCLVGNEVLYPAPPPAASIAAGASAQPSPSARAVAPARQDPNRLGQQTHAGVSRAHL